MLKRTTLREIRNSLGRYLAILAIVALGVGFFAGLKVTKESMIRTADSYYAEYGLFDEQLISTLGYDDDSVAMLRELPEVGEAEGSISQDVIIRSEDTDRVFKAISLPTDINRLRLMAGRLPEKPDECVLDSDAADKSMIGQTITFSDSNDEDTLDMFRYSEYKVVGIAATPLYINFERGSSELGTGIVSAFFCIPRKGFDTDYYTSIYVSFPEHPQIYSEEYKDLKDRSEPKIEAAAKAATKARYEDVVAEAQEKLDKQIRKYEDGKKELEEEKIKVYGELDDARKQIEDGEKELEKNKKKLAANKKKLQKQEKRLKKQKAKAKKKKAELVAGRAQIREGLAAVEAEEAKLEASKDMMPEEQYAAAKAQLEAQKKELQGKLKKVNGGLRKVNAGLSKARAGEKQIASGWKQIRDGEKKLKQGEKDLKDAKKQYEEGLAEADREFAKADQKLADARKKLDKAQKKVRRIKQGKTYVLDRNTNIGYGTFDNNAEIVNSISTIFPFFFFLVAALVCMTTMTRMVDDERTQIGVLKALGYSNRAVLGKYLFYAGSASAIGGIAGFFFGCWIFPAVIWKAYGMMLNIADRACTYVVNIPLFWACLAVALLCSMGSTWLSCAADFSAVPAELIRPKAPAAGKRILLERVGPLWRRIGFLYKVSIRNIFRYKKRFFMMVIGISGCTALIIAGFGINTSVKDFAEFQYNEVAKYDIALTFDKNMKPKDQADFLEYAAEYRIAEQNVCFVHQQSTDIVCGGSTVTATLIAADNGNFRDFIDLHSGETDLDYPGSGEAVVCRKMQEHYDVDPGDTITIRKGVKEMKVTVSAICDNYVYNYIYVSPETYRDGFGTDPAVKTAFINVPASESEEAVAEHASADDIRQKAANLSGYDRCVGSSANVDMRENVQDMMTSLNAVILLVIGSAGLLAFIVLYNLTNINITERIREIATIKVLGFYPGETSAYVFRENFFLTGFGALAGIPLGYWLLRFVVSEIKVDMVFFEPRITGYDYLWSVLLTFAFAIVVSLAMYRKLAKISMTESLKSID
ncbi:MAG: FtsX-like permease family protein [Eubacterium sp.]|nr:FtsX-like permease family protein [Eubacterium sp.]